MLGASPRNLGIRAAIHTIANHGSPSPLAANEEVHSDSLYTRLLTLQSSADFASGSSKNRFNHSVMKNYFQFKVDIDQTGIRQGSACLDINMKDTISTVCIAIGPGSLTQPVGLITCRFFRPSGDEHVIVLIERGMLR